MIFLQVSDVIRSLKENYFAILIDFCVKDECWAFRPWSIVPLWHPSFGVNGLFSKIIFPKICFSAWYQFCGIFPDKFVLSYTRSVRFRWCYTLPKFLLMNCSDLRHLSVVECLRAHCGVGAISAPQQYIVHCWPPGVGSILLYSLDFERGFIKRGLRIREKIHSG